MRKHICLLAVVAISTLAPLTAHASLKGLSGLRIAAPVISKGLSDDGLTAKSITAEVETALNAAKIPVIKDSYPFLEVEISSIASSVGVYSYSIDLKVFEVVQRTDPSKAREAAIIWTDGDLGTTDIDDLGTNMRASLDGIIERFIADYATDNPNAGVIVDAPPPPEKKGKHSDDPN